MCAQMPNAAPAPLIRMETSRAPLLLRRVVPGDDDKRDPERESWPCSLMLPILPIQSISGSRLLPSPGSC